MTIRSKFTVIKGGDKKDERSCIAGIEQSSVYGLCHWISSVGQL